MKRVLLLLAAAALVISGCQVLYPQSPPGAFTPIPPLPKATLPAAASAEVYDTGDCRIEALDLIGAWVEGGKPDSATFRFTALDGRACQGNYENDVQPLFTTPNLWYSGAIACTACHGADLKRAAGQMSLVDYSGVLAGSRRTDPTLPGNDILGGADGWEKALLYINVHQRIMPIGRPPDSPADGPVVQAGKER